MGPTDGARLQKRAKCYQTVFVDSLNELVEIKSAFCALSPNTSEALTESSGHWGCSQHSCQSCNGLCTIKNKKISPSISAWRTHHEKVFLSLEERISPWICVTCWNWPYCCAAERASWAFGWSGTWGFAVHLPWNCSISCLAFLEGLVLGTLGGLTEGFQGSNNREEEAETISGPVLINKNNPFSLPAWLPASSLTPALCSKWSLTKTYCCSECIGQDRGGLIKFN